MGKLFVGMRRFELRSLPLLGWDQFRAVVSCQSLLNDEAGTIPAWIHRQTDRTALCARAAHIGVIMVVKRMLRRVVAQKGRQFVFWIV